MSLENYFSLSLVNRIKFWKDKYKDSLNGWVVAQMIGEEYMSPHSRTSPQKRKKLKKRGYNDR